MLHRIHSLYLGDQDLRLGQTGQLGQEDQVDLGGLWWAQEQGGLQEQGGSLPLTCSCSCPCLSQLCGSSEGPCLEGGTHFIGLVPMLRYQTNSRSAVQDPLRKQIARSSPPPCSGYHILVQQASTTITQTRLGRYNRLALLSKQNRPSHSTNRKHSRPNTTPWSGD